MTDGDIDLFADVDSNFAAEDFVSESGDHFDDLVTKNGKEETLEKTPLKPDPEATATLPTSRSRPTQRYHFYMGNLTW
jgi:hypothetical protein